MKKEKPNVDVLKHFLVPKMEVLKEEERQDLIKKFGIEGNLLPRINSDDPAVSALGAKEGDMLRIRRKDETGEYDYYRIVV